MFGVFRFTSVLRRGTHARQRGSPRDARLCCNAITQMSAVIEQDERIGNKGTWRIIMVNLSSAFITLRAVIYVSINSRTPSPGRTANRIDGQHWNCNDAGICQEYARLPLVELARNDDKNSISFRRFFVASIDVSCINEWNWRTLRLLHFVQFILIRWHTHQSSLSITLCLLCDK